MDVKVDEVWIVTVSLHQEQPDKTDFAIDEIMDTGSRAHLKRTNGLRRDRTEHP
jgi:hypothetical protein